MPDNGLSPQDVQDLIEIRKNLPQGDQRAGKIDQLLMSQAPPPAMNPSVPIPLGLQQQPKPEVGKPVTQQNGEGFADFMQRVKDAGSQVTQQDVNNEAPAIKKDLPMALAAGPIAGFGGAAALAGPGEVTAGLKALIPLATGGAIKLGQWASANPVKAYLLYQLAKEAIPGVKKTSDVIRNAPTE